MYVFFREKHNVNLQDKDGLTWQGGGGGGLQMSHFTSFVRRRECCHNLFSLPRTHPHKQNIKKPDLGNESEQTYSYYL